MSLPQTIFQLLMLLTLVVPGITYSVVRRRLIGPGTDEKDFSMRLARAIAASVVFDSFYVLLGWPLIKNLWTKDVHGTPGYLQHPQLTAAVVLALAAVIPALVALAGQVRILDEDAGADDQRWCKRITRPYLTPIWHPAPNAWDAHAPKLGGHYVAIRTDDGEWVGGYLPDRRGYVSTYPEPRDIFIPQPFHVSDGGTFGDPLPKGRGLFVPLTGNERVYWFAPGDQPALEGPANQPTSGADQTPADISAEPQ